MTDAPKIHALLHRLWTKAVGGTEYVKDEWKTLEAEITSLAGERIKLREACEAILAHECTETPCMVCANVAKSAIKANVGTDGTPDEKLKAARLANLRKELRLAGDRRDWCACNRIEAEIEEIEGE